MSSDHGPLVDGETVAVASGPDRASNGLGRADAVHRITDARASHSDEIARRMRTYAVSMAIRTLCVAGFVLLFPHWTAWLMVPGAALLPYVAVLLANAGRESRPTALPRVPLRAGERRALAAGTTTAPPGAAPPGATTPGATTPGATTPGAGAGGSSATAAGARSTADASGDARAEVPRPR